MAAKKGRRRVPDTISKFDTYQKDSAKHLEAGTPSRGEELGLTSGEVTDWKDFRDEWAVIYPLYTNKNTRTATVRDDVNDHMDNFAGFAEPLLNRISGSSVINNTDRNVLNLPERDKTVTRRGKIDDKPIVGLAVIGGGQMKVRVRTTTDASRASMHDLADLIECRYLLSNENPATPGPVPPTGGDLPLPSQAPHFLVSKKATFEIDFGTANLGKFVVAFFRWVNTSNPSNNGPWTLPVIGLIG